MTPVAELSVYLAWIVVVESAERQAVVQFYATVPPPRSADLNEKLLPLTESKFPEFRIEGFNHAAATATNLRGT
jgi:hypothetical protein